MSDPKFLAWVKTTMYHHLRDEGCHPAEEIVPLLLTEDLEEFVSMLTNDYYETPEHAVADLFQLFHKLSKG